MADFAHLFIHPLIGSSDAWSGYLVESPVGSVGKELLQNLLQHPELAHFDKHHPWFFTVPLEHELALPLAGQFVPLFLAQPMPGMDTDKALAIEATLRQQKGKVALKTSPSQKLPGSGAWDYLLITTSHARTLPPYSLLGLSTRTTIIATDVHSHADHLWSRANACALATTEFLLNRHPPGKKADMSRLRLVELLSLLAADADTAQIEDIFRHEPKLAYSLLRLVNSAANSPRSPITSFSQAINLLGRRQLQRWLQLLVFADQNNVQGANPLLQKAATRGRLLELLAAGISTNKNDEHFLDAAFMAGTFSLLDVLLNMPIKEVLQHLPLPKMVQNALAEHSGQLGELLKAIVTTENRDLAAASKQLGEIGISPKNYLEAQLSALSWAARINHIEG